MRPQLLVCSIVFAPLFACGEPTGETQGTAATTSDDTSGSDATTTTGNNSTTDTSTTEGPLPDMPKGDGNQCSLILQDCNDGEKCVPWNENGGIFPDGVKCVPEPANADAIGSECAVLNGFGNGEDSCQKGSICLDLDDDGAATCVEFCSGSLDNPFCMDEDYKCVPLFEPEVPLCFRKCDPLVQNCGESEGCFMDALTIGSEGFVCMPLVENTSEGQGDYGELCIAASNCKPGFSCIWPENVPDCPYIYCCTPWCNTQNGDDDCTPFDSQLNCIPWYEPGQETPGFENVGICGIIP